MYITLVSISWAYKNYQARTLKQIVILFTALTNVTNSMEQSP